MRILIVHNILWAHYKASVFQALQRVVNQQPGVVMKVLQIARNERSRASLEANKDATTPVYSYEYELLFDRFLEDVSLRERTTMLLRRVRAFKPDVINLTGYYDPAQMMILLWAKANGIRVVVQNESTAADHQRGGWKEQLKRWIFARCDGFFCFGEQSAKYLIELGVKPSSILLRKNAVDNNAIRIAYDRAFPARTEQQKVLGVRPNNFVFVGRFITVKNLPTLLTSFAEARHQSPNAADWGLILLGDGPEKALIEQIIDQSGLSNVIKLLPGRPWFQVADILALSNVLVLTSISETWGLVVNEAMVCGLPVIVSDRCGCVPEIVHHGENGFVFDPNEPSQLTYHLSQFINGNVNVDQMSQLARQYIESYAPEVVAQEMLTGFIKVTG